MPRERTNCRLCRSDALREVLDLGDLAVSDFVDGVEPLYAPLALAVCDPGSGGCSFVQLKHEALDPSLLYRRYWYRSGTNESMRAALLDVVLSAQAAISLDEGALVLDIGANDGTLLRAYGRKDLRRVGFDPAENLLAEARAGTDLIVPECFTAASFRHHVGSAGRARIVTSIAMFYDLEQPHDFVRDVSEVLAPDGLWVVQMAYLPTMLANNNFDNICHEHVGYYSLAVMEGLLRSHGLEVRDVELNAVNGGSFRLYIQHASAGSRWALDGSAERLESTARAERELGLGQSATYRDFGLRIARIRDEVRAFVLERLSGNKVFHVYGASTRGNTILQYFGLDHRHFQMAADRSSDKWGLRTVATNIPIVSEDASRAARPDYYFVLPWHFRETFQAREEAFLRTGGAMVFPLPTPSVVRIIDGELREMSLQEESATNDVVRS
jgi:NDP-4-keto-2,6-dideoxyhexose 3-C-methyltransferase